MNQMKIVVDCLFMQIGTFGGMEIFTVNLLRAMAQTAHGLHFTVLCGPKNTHYFSDFNFPNVEVKTINLPTEKRSLRILYEQFLLPAQLGKWGADAFFGPAHIIPLRLKCPSVLTIHDLHWMNLKDTPLLKKTYINFFVKKSIEKADKIAVDSEFTRRDMMERFPGLSRDKVGTVYGGVNDSYFRPPDADLQEKILKRYKICPPFILNVGQRHKRKNLPMLMRAFASLDPDIGNKYKLVIAGGPGDEPADLGRLASELGVEGRLILTGIVENDELPALYRAADLFVYPSMWEGFGMPVIEAMASGTPVICSNISSLTEIGGDACVSVPPEPEPLREAMREMLSDPERQDRSSERGLERARLFSWRKAAESYIELFEKLKVV